MNVIRFNNVKKAYGAIQALRGVSFEVAAGEIVALLGPNGAGKTTAIEILLGLRSSDSGEVLVDGKTPQSLLARSQMAATPQNTGFPDALTVREIVAFAARHYAAARDVDATLAAFELSDLAGKRLGGLSGGQQRRVALALAFVTNTPLVLLDEPSTGLDVESRRRLWEQLRASVDAHRTVLFTTHYLEEAEALATRIIVIDRGELRFDGTPAAFRDTFGSRRVEYVASSGERVVVTPPDTDAYVRELVLAEGAFRDLHVTQTSFEEIFLELTGAAS
ncbi:MAG TPA: ABC transporter ATP-binding protein [Candidatus Baltobacteraceae bacterium]|nr:ABC transporter ATP-binding protein [Candidatus Baltobacteraceae bacterium]